MVIGGVERKAHHFVIDLPHSDGCFVKAYPAETTEAFLDGHVSAFAFLGGVPQSILYDNTKLAVARILGDGRRQRTRAFTELQSHYLFEDKFGRPGKGNDKGKVEGMVGYVRRNFLVPVPSFESFEALNVHLEARCLERMDAKLRGHTEAVANQLAEAGAEVEEIPLPDSFAVVHRFQRIVSNVECPAIHEANHRVRAADYGPRIRAGMEMGMIMPTSAYLKAQRLRRQFRADFSEMAARVDVVMTPAMPAPAPRDLNTTGDAAFQVPWSASGVAHGGGLDGPE